jgi:Ca2+-binding EF-hand superfamily protein
MKTLVMVLSIMSFTPAVAFAADDFAKLDSNGDGQASMDELTAAGLTWTKEEFASADKDGSGSLSKSEYEAAQKP